ncbi:MAG: ribose 5-phosphate isomerase B [Bacteroidia bacterium]|nr:ribose 5-phosphate isomerase B [Bacteroidia bacterium]MCZ2247364.1 ribose 5-phosphate isomerase B [Bacteroidia bacterium]
MIIAIGSDHAGFEAKSIIIEYLKSKNIEYKDFGTYSTESVDYPDIAHAVAKAVENKEFTIGILICGSGQGVNITANKYAKIRSALCWNTEIATLSRQHNDANILALPGRFLKKNELLDIVDIFLNTSFEGGRHLNRVNKISC